MTNTTKTATRGTTSRKPAAITVEPFTVPVEWVTITVAVEREDVEYLIETKHACRKGVGNAVWSSLFLVENIAALRDDSEGHAEIADPLQINIALEKGSWADVTRTCDEAKIDVGSAIRLAIYTRCCQIKRYRKRKIRSKAA